MKSQPGSEKSHSIKDAGKAQCDFLLRGQGKKVYVGLSGGVDSAVSAALLKKEGHEVTGVFIKAWTPPGYPCNWREDRRSAMRAAAVLDIPFITLDLEKEYKRDVVDYMIREYKIGRTPNPDVMCNKEIKFGAFLKYALANGADFVATGHYAKASPQPLPKGKGLTPRTLPFGEGRVGLFEAADKSKDQSYFLWTLTPDQLKHILFPVGHLQKSEVRKLAEKFKLPQATRKDSQGLCFLGKIDMKEFLKEYIKTKKGKVLDEKGQVVGSHDGAILYTLGERHGFSVKNQSTVNAPLYVVAKDIKNNTLTVSSERQHFERSSNMLSKGITLQNINIIGEIPKDKKVREQLTCRFRYRQEKVSCKITPHQVQVQGSSLYLKFNTPQLVAPGQSLVFYDGEVCLGGGVIS